MRSITEKYMNSVAFAAKKDADEAPAEGDTSLEVLELDSNLADAKKPPEIPGGKYEGEITGVEVRMSAANNKIYNIKFMIAPEQLPESMQEIYEDGAPLYWNRQVVPKGSGDRRAIWHLKQLYENIGLDSSVTTIDPNEWMGCKTMLTVGPGKPFNNEIRSEIKSMSPVQRAPARSTRAAAQSDESEAKPRGRRGRQ